MNNLNALAIKIALAIVTFFVVKAYFPHESKLGNQHVDVSAQKIVIIPMTGIPGNFLESLELALEEQHKTDVLVTTQMGKGNDLMLHDGPQYNSHAIAEYGKRVSQSLGRDGAYIIVLTNEDINYPDSGLRYLFSVHYPPQGLSVVSLARINPLNLGVDLNLISIPEKFLKMKERALKLINKALGYGIYGLEASSDINSVMYGPIMGPDDLDNVGNWYK